MKKDKLMYNPPVVEPLVIRFEGWVCQSTGVSVEGTKKGDGYAYGDTVFYLDDDED